MAINLYNQQQPIAPTLQEVIDAATIQGVPPDKAETFFHHYNAQGWRRANNLPITNLQSMLHLWKNNEYKFEKQEKAKANWNYCYYCGCSAYDDYLSKRLPMRWFEKLPFCSEKCIVKWVKEGRPIK